MEQRLLSVDDLKGREMAGNSSSLKVRSPVRDGDSSMENTPSMAEVMAFLNRLKTAPEFTSEMDGDFKGEDRNSPPRLLHDGEPDLRKSIKGGKEAIEPEKKVIPLNSSPEKEEPKPTQFKKEGAQNEPGLSFTDSFLIELVHNVKKGLASTYQTTVLALEKCADAEIRKRSQDQVKGELKKIDSVLNTVLNFINVNTPLVKPSTLCTILEEILEVNAKQLLQKNIKITKRYEKDISDTFLHPEQVKFILHSAIQYAILSTPPNQIIGVLVKSSDSHNEKGAEKPSAENSRRYIEVMIGFNGDGKPGNTSENSETPGGQREGMPDLILKLAKEILEKNLGMLVETHGERLKTLINLRFPVERRKVVYYEPIAL